MIHYIIPGVHQHVLLIVQIRLIINLTGHRFKTFGKKFQLFKPLYEKDKLLAS